MHQQITVRRPERAELPAVAEAYAAANLHDPVLSWVIDDQDARRRFTTGTGPGTTTVAYLRSILDTGEFMIAEDQSGAVVGVSLWEWIDHAQRKGASGLQDAEGAQFIEDVYGEYADRMRLLIELTGGRRPHTGAYWYLLNIVVAPGHRGQGIGGSMIREQLRRLDVDSMPAYLEASSPRNRKLYERFGFTDLGDPIELPDGPRLQPMWRRMVAEADRSRSTG